MRILWIFGIFVLITSTLICHDRPVVSKKSKVIEEEVVFNNGSLKFNGTIFRPKKSGKLPAIILGHGSGKEHRKLQGMRSVAQLFAMNGFMTLLFDKRGVGDSEGEYFETPDYYVAAGDLISAVYFMASRNDVDRNKIGLYGHSQAGWTIPLAAVACEDISFIAVSCGGGVSPLQQVIYSKYTTKQIEMRHSQFQIDSLTNYLTDLQTYYARKRNYVSIINYYKESKESDWFQILENPFHNSKPPSPDKLNHLGWTFFKKMMYDPELTLVSIKIPTLVILAEEDLQVPSSLAEEVWRNSYHKSGQMEKLEIKVLPKTSHALFETVNGKPEMRQAFSKPILAWLNSITMN